MSLSSTEYIHARIIKNHYGVCSATLRRWAEDGRVRAIKTPGGKRLYHTLDIQRAFGFNDTALQNQKTKVCYARVSTKHQERDLERQVQDLKKAYPSHEIIQDIGSGLNWNRKGFTSLLDRVQSGSIGEVVVAHRYRLCRFGHQLVERFFKAFGTQLVVQDASDDLHGTSEELSDDLLAIVTVFVARNNGRRAAENRRKRKLQAQTEELHGKQARQNKKTPCQKKQKNSRIPDKTTEKDPLLMVRDSSVDLQQVHGSDSEGEEKSQ